jgi:predicted ATPase with chaperone activity
MDSRQSKMRPIRSQSATALSSSRSGDAKASEPESPKRRPAFQPPEINSLADTGLSLGFLSDLVLKLMYFEGSISGYDIARTIKLPFSPVVEEALEFLRREKLCEVRGSGGLGESSYRYMISSKGSEKAREVLDRSMYVGPAPVPLDVYADSIDRQPLKSVRVSADTMRQKLAHLVIGEETFNQIGPAVNSGRSIFLFGPPGNGKTAIAESIGSMLMDESMYVPHAFEVDGYVVKVFDESMHQVLEQEPEPKANTASLLRGHQSDGRWVKIRRPLVAVGGELTLESLDLVFSETSKYYEAPFQIKANGGMFLIDDFGRQRMEPRELLNRWIVPLEKRIDYLTLHTGRKLEVPFDMLIVFSTNLEPKALVEEAFLRRIRHKIEVGNPSLEQFREIFRRECKYKGVPYHDRGLAYLLRNHYIKKKRPLRACHPRDLLDELLDLARFLDLPPRLSEDLIDRACEAYFVEL